MELETRRETLRFERMAAQTREQISIEGEASLPGSMRDAVTVLSVQAQSHLTAVQAGSNEAGIRGRVRFQVLYTQGDLTRIRALETSCDFEHTLRLPGAAPSMRLEASAAVEETDGIAANGRISLRALLGIDLAALETAERELITDIHAGNQEDALQVRSQEVTLCRSQLLGEGTTLAREEFDLPARLGVGDVLTATGSAGEPEITGGSGRVGLSGTVEVRVLHRAQEAGAPLVVTTHELPYEIVLDAQLPDTALVRAQAEVIDVMADSAAVDKRRTLRVEAEVRVQLRLCCRTQTRLLEDVYSTSGDLVEPVREMIEALTSEEFADVRESTRIQAALPPDAPPVATVLAAFVQPTLTAVLPAGRRVDAEGIMGVTLIYLPVDSDVPYAVRTREPFAMTFPVEAGEGMHAQIRMIEATAGPTTSDRAEIRCVLGLHTMRFGMQRIEGITQISQRPAEKQEHGFVLVWPAEGESRWDTARRLRVAPDSLRPAGKRALLALRR